MKLTKDDEFLFNAKSFLNSHPEFMLYVKDSGVKSLKVTSSDTQHVSNFHITSFSKLNGEILEEGDLKRRKMFCCLTELSKILNSCEDCAVTTNPPFTNTYTNIMSEINNTKSWEHKG